MIRQIRNLTIKSFKNYTTENNFFENKNVIFGYNGRGKSSLALGVVEAYKSSGEIESTYRLFNRDYVKDTLLLQDEEETIKGIKVTFSENDADIAEKIEKLKAKKQNTTTLREAVERSKVDLRKEIDSIHDKNKGNAKINRKVSNLALDEVYKAYIEDLQRAREINSSDLYIKSFEADNINLETNKEKLISIQMPQLKITKLSSEDKKNLFTILKQKYSDIEELPSLDILQWLEKGIMLHKDSNQKCLFCENTFSLDDVSKKVTEYKENEKQKDISYLENIKDKLEENLGTLERDQMLSSNLSSINVNPEMINDVIRSDYVRDLQNLISNIENKIKDMSKSYCLEDCISKFEEEIEKISNTIKKKYSEKIKEFDDAINNMEILTKGKIALKLIEKDFKDKITDLKKEECKLNDIVKNNKEIDRQIRKIEEQQSEYIDFMEFLNGILENLGIHIRLYLRNDNYYLQHTIEECKLTVDDISEGEKNLLALLYFYFELYTDNEQTKLKSDIDLIVIDDPISSLDDANKFYVLEIIKKILNEDRPQVFVLTHSWDDFCQITYSLKKRPDTKLFEIYKDPAKNFQSAVRECQANVAPYKKLFTELYELSQKRSDELRDFDIYHASNSMRRVFEEFLNFKKPNLLPQKSNQKQIEDIFEKSTGKPLGKNRKQSLGSFLSFINVLSHRPIRSEEILNNSKFFMRLIEDIDKVHFESMKQN